MKSTEGKGLDPVLYLNVRYIIMSTNVIRITRVRFSDVITEWGEGLETTLESQNLILCDGSGEL